ncbi:MAG: hypothetical protein GY937_05260 [bacterium]|nr:hypothetical protein [bacterium]
MGARFAPGSAIDEQDREWLHRNHSNRVIVEDFPCKEGVLGIAKAEVAVVKMLPVRRPSLLVFFQILAEAISKPQDTTFPRLR